MIDDIQAKTENAKRNMQDAIDTAVKNNSNIEDLNIIASDLESNADLFQKKAVKVKKEARQECCKAYLLYIILIIIMIGAAGLFLFWTFFCSSAEL